jgi:hypothetical protein
MGVTIDDVAQGALDLGKLIQGGMNAMDQATKATSPAAPTSTPAPVSAGPQPAAPATSASTAVAQSKAKGMTATAALSGTTLLLVGVGAYLFFKYAR